MAIDYSVDPPSFAIRVDGRERETEAHRLSLRGGQGGGWGSDVRGGGGAMSSRQKFSKVCIYCVYEGTLGTKTLTFQNLWQQVQVLQS